jgi:adenylylsulfate kinase
MRWVDGMRGEGSAEAVIITGAYGSGKSSLAAEIADRLEEQGLAYAALDLDWLAWADTGTQDESAEHAMLLKNLACVLTNYLDAGVRFFVVARAFRDRSELDSLIRELPMRVRLVRLTVAPDVIEQRLGSVVTSGRHDDLRETTELVARSEVRGVEDRTVSNDRPIREAAAEVLDWLDWGRT